MLEIHLSKQSAKRTAAIVLGLITAGGAGYAVNELRHGGVSLPQIAAAPGPSGPSVSAVVDTRQTFQTLVGFGAATAYYQNWIASHPYKDEIYTALFKDLNLQLLRMQNVYRGDPNNFTLKDDVDIVQGAQKATGHSVPILLSAWGPPAALKSNHDVKHGGTLAKENGTFVYEKYAQFWVDSLSQYAKAGITPDWVSLQNEPDWKASWESCLFKPTEQTEGGIEYAGYDKALDAVARRFQGMAHSPPIIGPEPTGIGHGNLMKYLPPSNTAELGELAAVAHHMYNGGQAADPDTFLTELHAIRDAYPNKIKMQTEYGNGGFFNTAWLIHNCVAEENASAYIFWSGIWTQGEEALILTDNPWQKSSWKYPHGWKINDSYWALKHYAFFTQPGWKRVAANIADPSLRISAFESSDGRKLTAILLNTSPDKTVNVRLTAAEFAGRDGVQSHVYCSTEKAPWQDRGPLPANQAIVMSARSVVTVTFP